MSAAFSDGRRSVPLVLLFENSSCRATSLDSRVNICRKMKFGTADDDTSRESKNKPMAELFQS